MLLVQSCLECCHGVLALNENEFEFMIGNGEKALNINNHRLQHIATLLKIVG